MSSKRWDKSEKTKLIKLYSEGKSFDSIAKLLDRSESAIRLRVQSIVYNGIKKGMTVQDISATFKKDVDTIKQMFFAYRSFKEGRGEPVISMDEISKFVNSDKKSDKVSKINKTEQNKNISNLVDDKDTSDKNTSGEKNKNKNKKNNNNKPENVEQKQVEQKQVEQKQLSQKQVYVGKLVEQNSIMDAIINNKELKKKIKTLYRQGKLTDDEKNILETILSK